MVEKQFLFPQYYINKILKCDICKEILINTGEVLMSNPPIYIYKCSNCNKTYNFKEDDIRGEWVWKTI